MKMELIDPRRVRIALSSADMRGLNVTYEELLFGASSLGPILLRLLDQARQQTGFQCKDKKLFVEIYPDGREGCVLFFTRLQKHTPAARYRIGQHALTPYLFRFQDADALIGGCRAVFPGMSHRVLRSSLYYTQGFFILSLSPLDPPRCAPVALMKEFGDCVGKGHLAQSTLAEHGHVVIANGAMAILAQKAPP